MNANHGEQQIALRSIDGATMIIVLRRNSHYPRVEFDTRRLITVNPSKSDRQVLISNFGVDGERLHRTRIAYVTFLDNKGAIRDALREMQALLA